jgi:hypothetical protein
MEGGNGVQRDLGRHDAQIEALAQDVAEIKRAQAEQSAKIDDVLLTLSAAKGGWKTILLVSGIASTVVEGLDLLFSTIGFHFHK